MLNLYVSCLRARMPLAERLRAPLASALLAAFCLGGASAWAARSFQRAMTLQGVRFVVEATGEGSQQQLTITATTTSGKGRTIPVIRETVNGQVVGAEVADLNGNGTPEIYVYVQGEGSGSYGELVAYVLIQGRLSPISLQELSGPAAKGYMGHDSFSVVEGCLVRRFPIYKSGDTNAKATGGLRQICYKLKSGEAGWILRPTSVLQF